MDLKFYNYDDVVDILFEKIKNNELDLNESVSFLLKNKSKNPEMIIEILEKNEDEFDIIDRSIEEFSFEPMIMEDEEDFSYDLNETTLMEIAIPIIEQIYPKGFLSYLNEDALNQIINEIIDIRIDEADVNKIEKRIYEFLSSASITIPPQGLNQQQEPYEIVKYGVFVPRLFKKINKNKQKPKRIKDVLSDFEFMEYSNPIIEVIPRLVYKVKVEKNKKG